MEILSSGSFINLENQEKIEQLKFTAAELANAALESSGFVNEEEPARALSLEFWQGLEYMCRESERGAIQNIFLNHFLECLRELRAPASTNRLSSPNNSQIELTNPIESRLDAEDEFLGVIETTETDEAVSEDSQTLHDEDSIITDDFSAEEDDSVEDIQIETAETVVSESEASVEVFNPETETSESETVVQENAVASSSFALPEKEPYQFNKCTVTVVVQLLPVHESSNSRKAVLSVRTHAFAPNISLVELDESNLTIALAPELEKVLAKYQADLPLKVMDKMRREKTAAKRITPKQPTNETKTVSQASVKQSEISSAQTTESEATQPTAPIIPQMAQTGLQGSLFG